jgi:hypothetical protein
MRIGRIIKSDRQGNILVVLAMCTALCLGVAGYFSIVQQQLSLSKRSQTWNVAMAIVEAGIEEGLEHLNNNHNNLLADGWTFSGNAYSRSQTLADGNSYTVYIENPTSINPSIVAKAFVNSPIIAQNRIQTGFFATSGQQMSAGTVARAVRVKCARGQLYTAAAVAKHDIDLNGNGILSDSYDSGSPSKSTQGRYDASKYSGDMGDIATNGGVEDNVGVGNANIYGRLHTGPNCPVDIGPNGAVGTHAWQAGNSGIQPGFLLQDANFTFPDTTLPSTAGLLPPPSGTVVVPTYSFSTNSITSAIYPHWLVGYSPIATNNTYITVSSIPNPKPAGFATNSTFVETATLPNPIPADLVTNYQTTYTSSKTYPTAGTYLGGVTKSGNKYSYNLITGKTYSYSRQTYSYPGYTYTYSYVGTNVTYTTNYYDYIVNANTTNAATSLNGKTLIAGPNACLVLPNGLSGAEEFTIAQGAGVLIYAGGNSLTVSGNQVLNPNGFAGSFIVFCAPSVKNFTLNGNGEFTGVLVAPFADLKLNGGGNSDQDFCGAMMVNSIRLNGHFKFHYDEALKRMPSNGRFLITSWDEISPY